MSGEIGLLTGLRIRESRVMPADSLMMFNGELWCRDIWRQVTFRLIIADTVKACRADLAEIVRAAESRLGLAHD